MSQMQCAEWTKGKPLERQDYKYGLAIISKRGKKAMVRTSLFPVLGVDAGWWCYHFQLRYSHRWHLPQTRVEGFLLRYEDFKDWHIARTP